MPDAPEEAFTSMPILGLGDALRRARSRLRGDPDRFLRHTRGVIHVGANIGQEAHRYDALGLHVLWVEPIPEIFARLNTNISRYPRQRALQALLTDREDVSYDFHVANNDGASSSILDFHLHKDVWPTVAFERSLVLQSTTLHSLVTKHAVDLSIFSALVMDTQGSELLVLRGAEPILSGFAFIKTEVADFESYSNCCQLTELTAFLSQRGFRESSRRAFAEHPGGGRYYDIVYQRLA